MQYYSYDYVVNLEDGFGNKIQDFNDSYTLGVWEDLQDVFFFFFEKEYNKPYNELSWYLEPNAKALYKEIESLWLQNKLDTFDLYKHNYDFQTFIMKKHFNKVSGSIERKVRYKIKTVMLNLKGYPYGDIVLYNIVNNYFEIEGEIQL